MSRRFVIGDIHGRSEAIKEVLQKSNFNYENDLLIILGDISDGGYNTYEVVEELLKIKNKVFILGNHDEWFLNHMKSGWVDEIWIQQGGANTLRSYGAFVKEARRVTNESFINLENVRIPKTHFEFYNSAVFYHIEDDMLFVHGGIDPDKSIEKQSKHVLLWDRELIEYAKYKYIKGYDKVFIGHTTTENFGRDPMIKDCMKPVKLNNLWMMDTGAGWTGKLTIMNIDTEEYWQSEKQEPAGR